MKTQIPSYISRRATLSTALCILLGTGSTVQAAAWTGTFQMYGPAGTNMGTDATVTGTEQSSVASTVPFFGFQWTARNLTMYTTAGVQTIATGSGNYTFTVASGEIYGHMLFDWNTTTDIDVLNKWTRTYSATGYTSYASVDFDCGAGTEGIRGCKMIDGSFPGFSANFDMTAAPAFAVTLSPPVIVFNLASQTFSTDLNNTDYSFDWDNNGTAKDVGGAVTTANTASLNVDASTLTAGTEYTLSVDITRVSDSSVVRADLSFTPIALTLGTTDSDGDGVNDTTEGSADSDGDGIPNFLDHSDNGTRTLPIDSSSTSSRALSSDSGVLRAGDTAVSKNVTNIAASTLTWNPVVTITDIGTTDSDVSSSCVGGCYDFKVTGLTTGGTAKIVVPLSAELPAHPVYRKFANGSWKGFVIDTNNSISSAAATGTGRDLCPAAGSSSYSTAGLTPGHYCIQLTIKDGGANDADGTANGIIVDPGGVGTTSDAALSTPGSAGSGCSISETPVNASERADWWLVAGFIAALAGLRLYRRRETKG